jgi:hypothetical protein
MYSARGFPIPDFYACIKKEPIKNRGKKGSV